MGEQILEKSNDVDQNRETVQWAKERLVGVDESLDKDLDQVEQILASTMRLDLQQKEEVIKRLRSTQQRVNERFDELVSYFYESK